MMGSTMDSLGSFCWANALVATTRTHAADIRVNFLSEAVIKKRMSRIYNSSATTDQVTDERVPSVPIRSKGCGFMLEE